MSKWMAGQKVRPPWWAIMMEAAEMYSTPPWILTGESTTITPYWWNRHIAWRTAKVRAEKIKQRQNKSKNPPKQPTRRKRGNIGGATSGRIIQ